MTRCLFVRLARFVLLRLRCRHAFRACSVYNLGIFLVSSSVAVVNCLSQFHDWKYDMLLVYLLITFCSII